MTSRNIFITDFSSGVAVEFSHKEFSVILSDGNARGITTAEVLKDAATEFVARRKGVVVDFSLK
jgi:hypothetical protein